MYIATYKSALNDEPDALR